MVRALRAQGAQRRHQPRGPGHAAAEPAAVAAPRRQQPAVTVQYAAMGGDLPARPLLRRWVRAALAEDIAALSIVLRFVEEAESRALNRRYRRRDRPTNVLAFVYDAERGAGRQALSGDIVLCAPVARHEATKQGKPLTAHWAHLVVHGMLHLQGYDHGRAPEAAQMEAREIAILARLGFGNPYLLQPDSRTKPPRRASR
jgi:probable rRNA maturation factor